MPNKKLNKIKVGNIYYDFGLIPETDLSINSLITNDISASNATINTLTIANDNILGPLNSDLTLKIGNKFNIYGSTSGSSSEYFRLFFDPEQTNFKIAYGTISKAAGHNISFNDVFSTIITPVSISTSGISTGTIYVENGIITTKNKLSVTPTPNTFSLPNKGGTIALTSDIPAPPKYYQHNIFGTFCDSPGETY